MRYRVLLCSLLNLIWMQEGLASDRLEDAIRRINPYYLSMVEVRFVSEKGQLIYETFIAAPGHFDERVRREYAMDQVEGILRNYPTIFNVRPAPLASSIIETGTIGGPKLFWECIDGHCTLIGKVEEVGNVIQVTCGTGVAEAAKKHMDKVFDVLKIRANLPGSTILNKIVTRANPAGAAVGAAMDVATIAQGIFGFCALVYWTAKAEAGTPPTGDAPACHDQYNQCRGATRECETSWWVTQCYWDGPHAPVPPETEAACHNQLNECLGRSPEATDPENIEDEIESGLDCLMY